MPLNPLFVLSERLSEAATFEEAAEALLQHELDLARSALADQSVHGEVLRAMVHLRPDEAYRRLVVLDARAEHVSSVGPKDELRPSATAWRFIRAHEVGVAVDVAAGILELVRSRSEELTERVTLDDGPADATLARWSRGGTTHVFALPLSDDKRAVIGMVSLEVMCNRSIGGLTIWPAAYEGLRVAADLAAPRLANLPLASPEPVSPHPLLPVIGKSMTAPVELLRAFAPQRETLLLTGPTGTGKSRMARYCHVMSERADGPFEVVDLISVPEEMQMGELFGWRKGAFTGAADHHEGSVERATGGTLFIDEIDKLSSKAQAGLLFLLEEHQYRVLGDSGPLRSADVRFIVGTNADLRQAVSDGKLRNDLYYRINVLAVDLPAMDERRDELVPWARYMLERRHAQTRPDGRIDLADEAHARIERASWPGNLRQLDNTMRRAYALAAADDPEAESLLVADRHIERSLLAEREMGNAGTDSLRAVATRFVERARTGDAGSLDLDLVAGLRGLVLLEAVRVTGSREDAFRLFGRESLVKGRNHHKALQRELAKTRAMYVALSIPIPADLEEILD